MVNRTLPSLQRRRRSIYGTFRVERDLSEYRGTGGVLRDLAADYDDDDLILVCNAAQILLDPLAAIATALDRKIGDVTLVSHNDGTPSGVQLVACKMPADDPGHRLRRHEGTGAAADRGQVRRDGDAPPPSDRPCRPQPRGLRHGDAPLPPPRGWQVASTIRWRKTGCRRLRSWSRARRVDPAVRTCTIRSSSRAAWSRPARSWSHHRLPGRRDQTRSPGGRSTGMPDKVAANLVFAHQCQRQGEHKVRPYGV